MKMLSEQGSQLVLPTQGAYDLRDGQFGKESMGLQAYRQHSLPDRFLTRFKMDI